MYLLTNEAYVNLDFGTAALIAMLGYMVVFFGLILLMCVIILVGKIMVSKSKKSAAPEVLPSSVPVAEEKKVEMPAAPGSAGELKLHDVDPKTAAILMAIVADKMGKPINELRFKSIREVK